MVGSTWVQFLSNVRTELTISKSEENTHLDAVSGMVKPLMLGATFLAIAHYLVLPADIEPISIVVAGVTAFICFVLYWFIGKYPIATYQVYPTLTLIFALLALSTLVQLYFTQNIRLTTNLIILIAAAGFVYASSRWLAIVIGTILASWILAIFAFQFETQDILHFLYAMIFACLLAVFFYLTRKRLIPVATAPGLPEPVSIPDISDIQEDLAAVVAPDPALQITTPTTDAPVFEPAPDTEINPFGAPTASAPPPLEPETETPITVEVTEIKDDNLESWMYSSFLGKVLHKDGMILRANNCFANMVEVHSEHLIGQELSDLLYLHDEPLSLHSPEQTACLLETQSGAKRVQILTHQVEYENHQVSLTEVLGMQALEDANARLVETSAIVSTVLDSPTGFSIVISSAGKVEVISESLSTAVGIPTSQIVGRYVFDVLPDHFIGNRKDLLAEVFRTGQTLRYEEQFGDRYFDTNIFPVTNNYDEVIKVALIGYDITDRKQTAAALKESEWLLRQQYEETQRAFAETRKLYKLSQTFISDESSNDLLQNAVTRSAELLGARSVLLVRLESDESNAPLELMVGGAANWMAPNITLKDLETPLITRLFERRLPILISRDQIQGLDLIPNAFVEALIGTPGSVIFVPVQHRENLKGFLAAINYVEDRDFVERDVEHMEVVASHLAVSIDNIELFKRSTQRANELQTLIETANAPIFGMDIEGRINEWNRGMVRLTGLPKEKAIGINLVSRVGSDGRKIVGDILSATLLGQEQVNFEVPLLDEQGTITQILVSSAARYDDKGDIVGALCVGQDITERLSTEMEIRALNEELEQRVSARTAALEREISERRQAEVTLQLERELLAKRVEERTLELSTANQELAKAAKMKDEFLASMSHELRTPLNAVLGMAEALEENVFGGINNEQRKAVKNIEDSGRHLLSLINDILDLSKIEAGKFTLIREMTSIDMLVVSSIRMIEKIAHDKNITLTTNVRVERDMFKADSRRMKQILVNLLSNAVKFTPDDGRVGLDVYETDEGDTINFAVWDTGIGISKEDQEKLFKPFQQLDSRLSRRHEGTGLGLALVAKMAELHGGQITLDSKPNVGSRFTVVMPWVYDEDELNATSAHNIEGERTSMATSERAMAPKLISEDLPMLTDQVANYIKRLSFEPIEVNNFSDAIRIARQEKPQVIILDPTADDGSDAGWQLVTRFKNDSIVGDVPLVLVSVADHIAQGIAMGAADYLVKPATQDDLAKSLNRVMPMPTNSASQAAAKALIISSGLSGVSGSEKPRILLAEDNEQNVNVVQDYLESKGYEIVVAWNGVEVVEKVEEVDPVLILMDIQMPEMDGMEATRRVRKMNHKLAEIPIIALTAMTMPGDRQKCLDAGMNDYVSKPLSLKGLQQMIEKYIRQKASNERVH